MRILVAEDDDTSRLLLGKTLKKLNHEVTFTKDGHEAWSTFKADPKHALVITDWMMPGMTGLELCRNIRGMRLPDYTYVFILTTLSGKGRFLEGMEAGADDFITKPFDSDELAARLRVAERILGLEKRLVRLEGLLPICSYCKKIRDGSNEWSSVETYVQQRSEASFSHSICPNCFESVVGELEAADC